MPPLARLVVRGLADQIGAVQLQLARLEKEHRDRTMRIPTFIAAGNERRQARAAACLYHVFGR